MKSSELNSSPLERAVGKWDEMMSYLEEGNDMPYGFLQLAKSDLEAFSHELVCEYCRNQTETEIKVIEIGLDFSRIANEWTANGGLKNRLDLVGRAVPLIARLVKLEFKKNF
jgi:hypothetical protein